MFAVLQAGGGTDPRVGTWTLTSAQSSLDPANKLSIAALPGGAVHVVMSGEMHMEFTAKANGPQSAVPGNPGFNQIEMKRVGKQVEVKEMKDGTLVATLRDKLSSDGNELTILTVSKGRPDQTSVWTRSGGAKAAHDPLAGEWTQDLSKSRMRQGLVVKIEAEGRDGERFSGDFSYTAHFDGKQYDVKGSRNDSVALQMVDAHTVDAVYRRDAQVSQKDRWVVSGDGMQMTVTSLGSLETGQKFSEKLVFKKQ